MLGDYPSAVQNAVIGSMGAHKDLSMQFLGNEQVSKGVAEMLLEILKKGLRVEAAQRMVHEVLAAHRSTVAREDELCNVSC